MNTANTATGTDTDTSDTVNITNEGDVINDAKSPKLSLKELVRKEDALNDKLLSLKQQVYDVERELSGVLEQVASAIAPKKRIQIRGEAKTLVMKECKKAGPNQGRQTWFLRGSSDDVAVIPD
jgi:hypothetical protein